MTRAKGRRVMANETAPTKATPAKAVAPKTETDNDSPVKSKLEDVAFFNAQDGVVGRDGGPYLDQVERVATEQKRAFAEGREVKSYGELLNEALPASVGTDLRIARLVPDNRNTSNPSMANVAGLERAITDETFDENDGLADPISVLPVDKASTADPDAVSTITPRERDS